MSTNYLNIGIDVNGPDAILLGNDASSNSNPGGSFGIVLNGDNAVLRGNTASGNFVGILASVTANGNIIGGNTALGNVTDLEDDNVNCDQNVWRGNEFETDEVAGVDDQGPKAGCIR